MKRTLSILISLLMLLTVYSGLTVNAEEQALSGKCGENILWELDMTSFTLYLRGSGSMTDYKSAKDLPWYDSIKNIQSLEMTDGITSIGDNAFNGAVNLRKINSYSNTLERIGNYAFYNCKIIRINLPEGIKTIGANSFANCGSLMWIGLPDGITDIGENAFKDSYYVKQRENSDQNGIYINTYLIQATRWDTYASFDIKDGTTLIAGAGAKCSSSKITIPQSVKYIGANAFSKAPLTEVTIPETVLSLGDGAFSNCEKLKVVTLPDTDISLGDRLFYNCPLLESVKLPKNITKIGSRFFEGCRKLEKIEIPQGVEEIGEHAFAVCNSLTELVIPASVRKIGVNLFYSCEKLETVTIEGELIDVPDGVFNRCGALKEVKLSEGITSIGENAFNECKLLESITIPNTVTKIGKNAFYGCTELADLKLGSSIESIGDGAFMLCKINSVNIPDSVVRIDDKAFGDCSELSQITIGNGVEFIGEKVFKNTAYVNDASNYDNGLLYIDKYLISFDKNDLQGEYKIKEGTRAVATKALAFSKGITGITIPKETAYIGANAFEGMVDLEFIKVEYGNDSFTCENGILYNKEKTTLITYPAGKKDETFVIENVKVVKGNAFYGNKSLKSLSLASGEIELEPYAFAYASGVEEITLSDGLTSLPAFAFYGCTSLKSITIPDTVSEIGQKILGKCAKLQELTTPFVGVDGKTGYVGENRVLGYFFDTTGYTYSYTAAQKYSSSDSKEFCIPSPLEKVVVTRVEPSHGAFSYCKKIKEIILPETAKYISSNLFSGCTALEKIKIPKSTKTIGAEAFAGCESISDPDIIGDGVNKIGEKAFSECTALPSINIPDSVVAVMEMAFYGCSGIETIKFSKNLSYIGEQTFSNCTGIKILEIPDNVLEIGLCAFSYCSGIEKIIFGENLMTLERRSFEYCGNLKSVVIPRDINKIDKETFSQCSNLSDIYFCGTEEEWNDILFESDWQYIAFNSAKVHYNYGQKPSISIPKSKNLYLKETYRIIPVIEYGSGKIKYSSSNKSVVKVDSKGKITALKKGAAKITVSDGDAKSTMTVTVKNPTLNKTKLTLKAKKSYTLRIKGLIGKAAFKSSNKKIAKVSSSGAVKGLRKGSATITVTANGIKLKCIVKVK